MISGDPQITKVSRMVRGGDFFSMCCTIFVILLMGAVNSAWISGYLFSKQWNSCSDRVPSCVLVVDCMLSGPLLVTGNNSLDLNELPVTLKPKLPKIEWPNH